MMRHLPVYLAVLILMIFLVLIVHYEKHLADGKRIYVELSPVDPRSLIQGDYMRLDYQLHWSTNSQKSPPHGGRQLAYVKTDSRNIVTKTSWQKSDDSYALILHAGEFGDWRPAAESFLFSEGLGTCYQQAKFAELSVNSSGVAMLAALLGDDLRQLNCESKASWFRGAVID